MVQTAPGRYETQFDSSALGGYLISVGRVDKQGDGVQTLTVSRSYSPELAQEPVNRPLLQQLSQSTGGIMMSDPADVWKFRPGTQPERYDLMPVLLLLGLIAFIADIAWRLLGLRFPTKRLVTVSEKIVGQINSGVTTIVHNRREPESTQSDLPLVKTVSKSEYTHNDTVLPALKLPKPKKNQTAMPDDSAILGGKPIISDEDPFPLVADLDAKRRREKTENRQ
jgi:hypothetical protein